MLKNKTIYIIKKRNWITTLVRYDKIRLAERVSLRNKNYSSLLKQSIKKANRSLALIKFIGVTNTQKYEAFIGSISSNTHFIKASPVDWEKWKGYKEHSIIYMTGAKYKKIDKDKI